MGEQAQVGLGEDWKVVRDVREPGSDLVALIPATGCGARGEVRAL